MAKMNLKKRRIKMKPKYIIYLIMLYMTFSFSFYYFMKNNKAINNENFIKLLLSGTSYNSIYEFKVTNSVNSTVKFITSIDLTNPVSIINNKYKTKTKDILTLEQEDNYYNVEELQKISQYIEDPYKVDVNNPIIYIYNTHQLENYDNKNLSIYNITPNVLMASYILKEKLNKLGISTIVEDTNLTEFMNINGWDYNSAYKATRLLLLDKKAQYPSLKLFIDFHRDSVEKNISTTEISGRKYAKILFVIGLENENNKANISQTEKLNNLIKSKYPGLTRGIYKKEGAGVNGVYNQDIDKNVMLLEMGAVENNIEEVFNTLELIAPIIKEFAGGL